jgi:hypothetical protein
VGTQTGPIIVSDREEQPEFGLVMPFVTMSSKGGPHDDISYTAGWEMGALDARLQYEHPAVMDIQIHAENVAQADLIAMHYGYRCDLGEPAPWGWQFIRLVRVTP